MDAFAEEQKKNPKKKSQADMSGVIQHTDSLVPLKKHPNQIYPDEVKKFALALWSTGMGCETIGEQMGINSTSIRSWTTGLDIDKYAVNTVALKIKESMSNMLIVGAQRSFNAALADDKIEKASALQLSTMGCQMIDKYRLLKGESTENLAFFGKQVVEINVTKSKVGDEIKAMELEVEEMKADKQ